MLEWFAPGSPLYQVTQRLELRVAERAIKLEIELHPLHLEHMGKQVLDVEARVFHTVLCKVGGGRLDNLQHGFHHRRSDGAPSPDSQSDSPEQDGLPCQRPEGQR